MSKEEKELFKSVGRILCSGEKAVRFWLRVVEMEKEIEEASEQVREGLKDKGSDAKGNIPLISEYKVDDDFMLIYIILITLDTLGIEGGQVVVYYTDPEHREEVLKLRNELADCIMGGLRKRFEELPIRIINPKKQL
jgi:hypothetical protein